MIKVVGSVVFVFTIVLLPRSAWLAYMGAGVVLLVIAALSRLSPLHIGMRFLVMEPFALCVALLSLFQQNGLQVFLAMLIKSTLCLFCMILLAATTRFSDVLRTLQSLRVPPLLVTTLALMYRYLFVLFDEMSRMRRARRSRTFSVSRWFTWHSSATVIGHLFVRASERAERIYAAMCARGWKT